MPTLERTKPKRFRSLQPSKLRLLTDVQAAWMGAMIEGEGSINVLSLKSATRLPWTQIQVSVTNTCYETLEKCLSITGAGRICVHNKGTDGRKPSWRWWLTGRLSIQDLLRAIYPYLTGKRARALEALRAIERGA